MDNKFENLVDEQLINECDQIRSIAKKSWLSSAGVSLAHLDSVKAKVYNVGIADPRELKATNLREKKNRTSNDLPTNPPLSTVSLQQTASTGSNNSIPDLLRQHSNEKLQRSTRPVSASTRKTRPPSGRRPRPQSAKEPIPDSHSDPGQPFGVKGAKYDPGDRPPKGISNSTTTGWVGPPAGLKYPDRPPSGQSWKLEFPKENNHIVREPPPPPQGTPVPPSEEPPVSPEQEEKTKRVFELFIGDPYTAADNDDDDLFEDSDTDFGSMSPVEEGPPPTLLRKPATESLRLSLPTADEDDDQEEEMDTDRLLLEAEMVTKKLDLQQVFKLNKINPTDDLGSHNTTDPPTGSMTCIESHTEQGLTSPTTTLQDSSARQYKLFAYTASPVPDDDHDTEILNDLKIEDDVSTVIGDENVFNAENEDTYLNHSNSGKETELDGIINDTSNTESQSEIKGIIHDHKDKSTLEHEKTFVKFSVDKNVTVDITPRNLGRKVTELMPPKKKKTQTDSFVDLIEVKSRIEPVLQAGKANISPRKVSGTSRPPSGKYPPLHTSQLHKNASDDKNSSASVNQNGRAGKEVKPISATGCLKTHSGILSRPRSVPLNRVVSQVTKVTVDYGEEPQEISEQKTDKKSKSETKPKKRKPKSRDDVVTMMQKLELSEGDLMKDSKKDSNEIVNRDNSIISDENFAKFDANTGTLTATVCKSEPEKNYYELARHSSMSNKDDLSIENSSQIYKTTKTIEFDKSEPKEMSIKSTIDPLLIKAKEKEKFLSPGREDGEAKRGRPPLRPSSADVTRKPPVPIECRPPSLERPGSRRGFVSMAPDKTAGQKSEKKKQTLQRPASAPSGGKPSNQQSDKTKTPEPTGQTVLTEKEKEEREKVIDNLLERTKTLLGEKEEGSTEVETETKKVRPVSAQIAILRSKEKRRVKSAGTRRPVSAVSGKSIIHRHTGSSCKTPRKSPSKKRTVITEPCIINTNTSFDEDDAEEYVECKEMEKNLADKGVNIKAETLQRALYPPTGRTKYYRITADLPRSNSLTLLSHPKNWLPEEWKKLQKAEKTLARANEIMYLQHRAEQRRAKLAEMSPEEQKKMKKKGKKGGKKLRRSKSFG